MNNQLKSKILNNEIMLKQRFPKYKTSIAQVISGLLNINHDYDLYKFITAKFRSKEANKVKQVEEYNKQGFLSAKQILDDNIAYLDMNDKSSFSELVIGQLYDSYQISSFADNYNIMRGMYYNEQSESIIIKADIRDDSTYSNKWIKEHVVLKYFMQTEDEKNSKSLRFSHQPNRIIFESIMNNTIVPIHVFTRKKERSKYVYEGIFTGCGVLENNKAFTLYKAGFEFDVPLDFIGEQLIEALLDSDSFENESELTLMTVEATPTGSSIESITKNKIKTSKRNYLQQQKVNMQVGLRGEMLAILYEKDRLISLGRQDLADQIKHVSLDDDSLGYDILSYNIDKDGNQYEVYIEVKTTVCKLDTDFFISTNEIETSKKYADNYWLYRVYDIYQENPKFYKVTGELEYTFNLIPNGYIAKLKEA